LITLKRGDQNAVLTPSQDQLATVAYPRGGPDQPVVADLHIPGSPTQGNPRCGDHQGNPPGRNRPQSAGWIPQARAQLGADWPGGAPASPGNPAPAALRRQRVLLGQ